MKRSSICILFLLFILPDQLISASKNEIQIQKYDQNLCEQQRAKRCLQILCKTEKKDCTQLCLKNAKDECRQAGE